VVCPWLAHDHPAESARLLASWIFALLAATTDASTEEEVMTLDAVEQACITRREIEG